MKTEIEQITEDSEEEIDQMAEIEKSKHNMKLFGLYDVSEVKVEDPGLKRYINLEPKLVVKSCGRVREKFSRAKINVIELLTNLIAVPGHRGKKHKIQTSWKTGKYSQNMKIVLECLKIIESRTKQKSSSGFD
jgi:small subunit ribosomal protein S7